MEEDSIAVNPRTYRLHEVLQSVQSVLQKSYQNRQYWVRCELSRISVHAQSGHCYIELVDKNETTLLAQLKGIIWSDRYKSICEKFHSVTSTPLANGMKVLFQCSITFHPVHGLSLTITDIEPSFTLGEMARSKTACIKRLKAENLFDRNRLLPLPLLPQRIAVISVATSRGYQDFISTLQNYPRKYAVSITLFEAILQGENAVPTISRALKKIESLKKDFDAIAIIRGGAGDVGLACYDEYELCRQISTSPLPVITGIGHATNETVAEMIAFHNCITPTAAASFLLQKFDQQFFAIQSAEDIIIKSAALYFKNQKQHQQILTQRFALVVRSGIVLQQGEIKNLLQKIPALVTGFFQHRRQSAMHAHSILLNIKRIGNLESLNAGLKNSEARLLRLTGAFFVAGREKLKAGSSNLNLASRVLDSRKQSLRHSQEKIKLLDPVNTLRRGYSITRLKGKSVTDSKALLPGTILETQLAEGSITSVVK